MAEEDSIPKRQLMATAPVLLAVLGLAVLATVVVAALLRQVPPAYLWGLGGLGALLLVVGVVWGAIHNKRTHGEFDV